MKYLLSDLGEKEVIKRLEKKFPCIGDDAAWLKFNANTFLILATDMVYEKTHFLPRMSFEQFGKFVVSINLSDCAAMSAQPIAFLLSFGCPCNFKVKNFFDIIKGVEEQCKKFKVKFVGGDTKENEKLTLAGSIFGFTKKPILRSGAKINDIICVTGTIGSASIGTEILKRKLNCKNNRTEYEKILKKTLEPVPRVNEGIFLGKYVNSMTDISDSLAMSLHEIAEKSNVGVEINLDKLPLLKQAIIFTKKLNLNIIDYALYGGGDYELLFTLSKKNLKKIENKIKFTKIGKIVSKRKGIIAVKNGKKIKIKKKGYEHFKK